jgi:hypothetical protein
VRQHLTRVIPALTLLALVLGACGTAEPSDPVAAAPAITCVGMADETCRQVLELVRTEAGAAIDASSAIVIVDTCPPEAVCDRAFAFDAAVAVVPADRAQPILLLHVFGQARPDQVEPWQGPLPQHLLPLMPAP